MPKYLVSITNTEVCEDTPHPNLNFCEVVIADNRGKAIEHAATIWANTYINAETTFDDIDQARKDVVKAIYDGYDEYYDTHALSHDEWAPMLFRDADDGGIVQTYVVRITCDVVRAVDVTA